MYPFLRETGKSYPDIHSLLLLSTLFDVSLDQLIKPANKKSSPKQDLTKENIAGSR